MLNSPPKIPQIEMNIQATKRRKMGPIWPLQAKILNKIHQQKQGSEFDQTKNRLKLLRMTLWSRPLENAIIDVLNKKVNKL